MNDCIFCRIVQGQIPAQKVFENDGIVAILDINPVAPGHTLVLPKAHYETVTDTPIAVLTELITRAQAVAKAVVAAANAEGFNLLANNHKCSGQAIPHVHFHVIPRRTGDGVKYGWPAQKYKDGETEQWAERIKSQFQK